METDGLGSGTHCEERAAPPGYFGVGWGCGGPAAMTCARFSLLLPVLALVLSALGLFAAKPAAAQEPHKLPPRKPLPSVPTNLSAQAGVNSFTASWTASPGADRYELRFDVAATRTRREMRYSRAVNSGSITSLTINNRNSDGLNIQGGTQYRVVVRACISSPYYGGWGCSDITSDVTVTPRSPSPAAVAVSLSATPNPVTEGSPVTVTATLTEALSEAVTVPLTVTRGTSEAGDHGSLASITLPAGVTSATGTISTTDDDDGDDETFTVALGGLPSGLGAGTASSVEVTITDSGAQQQQRTVPLTLSGLSGNTSTDGSDFSGTLDIGAFAPGTTTYTATVENAVTHVKLTPTVSESGATVKVGKGASLAAVTSGSASGAIALAVGANALTVEVTAGDGTTKTYAVTVTRAAALTARLWGAVAEHDGETPFMLELVLSESLESGSRWPSAAALKVKGGSVESVRRFRPYRFQVHVKPKSWKDVTVTLAGGRGCGEAGAVCTADGRSVSNTSSVTVGGPVRIRIDGARAKEGKDASLDFAVTLNRAASQTVSVDYATADETATAGADYTATSGTLTFAAGETAKTVSVPVLDDAVDEGKETMRLLLSNPQGAFLRKKHERARGIIRNDDPLQRAWLSRFGRTVAGHVTDAVGDRLRGAPGQDAHVTIGGYRLPLGRAATSEPTPGAAPDEAVTATTVLTEVARMLGLGPGAAAGPATPWAAQRDPRLGQGRALPTFRLREVLQGSAFRLNLGATDADAAMPRLTAWGRVAGTTFEGRDGALDLNGDVLTGTVGLDGQWDRLMLGLAVAHSRGNGGYGMQLNAGPARGNLEQTLTSLHPYLRYAVTDRLDVWGLVGYGWGELDLEMANGVTVETDTTLVMGAFGGRGILLAPADTGGFQLATRTDAMLTRTSSDAVANSVATDADAHRLRVILEGSRGVTWADGRSLTPTVELGVRHDWGDAETGFGLEVGGRVSYADPTLGLTVEGTVRGLLAHEADAYKEWGASGTVRLDPGAAGRGLSVTLAPTWGAVASGVDGLWARQTTQGLAPATQSAPRGRLAADVGYGFAAFDSGLLTPYAGTVLSDGADRTYRVGTRVRLPGLTLNLEGTRQAPTGPQPVNQGLRLQVEWGF